MSDTIFCFSCFEFISSDPDDLLLLTYCPCCSRPLKDRELTTSDIYRYLDIIFGDTRFWKDNTLRIGNITYAYFEINDLDVRKKEMEMFLTYFLKPKDP